MVVCILYVWTSRSFLCGQVELHKTENYVGGTVVSPALLYLHRSLLGYPWLLRRGMFVVFWVVPCGACASDRVSGERSDHNIVGSEAVRLQWSHSEESKLLPDSSEHMIISVLCCLAAVSKIPCRHATFPN